MHHIKTPPNFTGLEGCFRYSGMNNDHCNQKNTIYSNALSRSTTDFLFSCRVMMEEIAAHNEDIKPSRSKNSRAKRIRLNPVNIEDDATVTVR